MDLKLWEYIFEMFNYKIRQKKIDFFKITNPYPALNAVFRAFFPVNSSRAVKKSQMNWFGARREKTEG